MSFSFKWNAFAKQETFQNHIRELLTNALNKNKPRILEDKITVLNLDWGNEAPTLEMLEIGDVALDRFRGVFKLNYNGGATITVATKVQANLLNVYQQSAPSSFVLPQFVDAPASFPIPLHLTLRKIRLQGTVIVVFSKSKGLTLVFRNDPLQSIEVSSTFDTVQTIASFLQQQIETQIRALFREEVPAALYQLSLKYLPSYSQGTPSGELSKSKDTTHQPVAFADIDSDKPVSLVNMLHIEAMLSSRRTLALETPIMPTAIVRSELHHRDLLTRMQSPGLNLAALDSNFYDQIYHNAKIMGLRSTSQKPPRRRTVKLGKKNQRANRENSESQPSEVPSSSSVDGAPYKLSSTDAHTSINEHSVPTNDSPTAHVQQPQLANIPIPARIVEAIPHGISISPFGRDTKRISPFALRHPTRFVLTPAPFHNGPLPVHEIDELPPAYVA